MSLTFNDFKEEASKILNLKLDSYKIQRVERRTKSLMQRHNIADFSQCLTLLKRDPDFRNIYLDYFTINTSEFFRNPEQFSYLQDNILTQFLNRKEKLKIWSAPCSDGSEPYTIAILLSELKLQSSNFTILASDLDPNILEIAKKGIYGANSLKNVPEQLLKKYFKKRPGNYNKFVIKDEIKNKVKFEKKDLTTDSFPENWDLILTRNFFIYLTNDIKKELTKKFTAALKPNGFLFLGNTEFLFNPEKYNLKKYYSSIYQKI